MVSSTVQPGVLNGTPIVARNPPPEGQMAVQIPVALTPSIYAANNIQQLSSGQVGGMSQVVSFIVDNSNNSLPLIVTHGALNETTTVPAMTMQTLPTFSLKDFWQWSVATPTAPGINTNVNLIALNYERAPSTVRQSSTSIQNTGENSGVLIANTFNFSGNANIFIGSPGAAGTYWILDSLEIAIEALQCTAAGFVGCVLKLVCATLVIEQLAPQTNLGGAGDVANNPVAPVERTWPQGLLIPFNAQFFLQVSGATNLSELQVRCNLTGYNT